VRRFETLATAETPDGEALTLHRRDGDFFLYLEGEELMSTRAPGTEVALAELGCGGLAEVERPRVLIGGLGLGFTLRATLAELPRRAEVVVAEIVPEVVEWHRRHLGELGRAVDDPRVTLRAADVAERLAPAAAGHGYHAVLLDVDNGPSAWCLAGNERLYGAPGLGRALAALVPGGRLAVWSAYRSSGFVAALRRAGFAEARAVAVRGHGGKGVRHTVFVGDRPLTGRRSGRASAAARRHRGDGGGR